MKRKLFNLLFCLVILGSTFVGLSNASILSNGLVQAAINNREYSDGVLKTKYNSYDKTSYICKSSEYNCGLSSSIFKIKKGFTLKVDGQTVMDSPYYICGGDGLNCDVGNAVFQIQNGYVCPIDVNNSWCNNMNTISFPLIPVEEIVKVLDGGTSSRVKADRNEYGLYNGYSKYGTISNNNGTYYICIGGYSCSKSSAVLQMKKDGRYYYVCDGNDYSCSNSSSIMQINSNSNSNNGGGSIYDNDYDYNYNITDWDAIREEYNTNMQAAWDEYHNNMCKIEYGDNAIMDPNNENACVCMEGYTWNNSRTSCVSKTSSCSSYGPNSYLGTDNLCYCKIGYGWDTPSKTYCVAREESCKGWYGENVYAGTDGLCYCKVGYQRNSDMTSCVKSQTTNTTKKYFSDYKVDAYNFAFANGITTMDSIDKADMYGTLDRIAMAKMVGNYAINILGLTPDTTKSCYFPDVASSLNEQYGNGVTKACQLGLMGQGITKFRPWDKVTRAEFATVLSRLINRDSADLYSMNNAVPYFSKHMEYLKNNGIIDSIVNLSEYDNEVRGYVMLMLMRSANTYDDVYDYYDSISELFFDCFDTYDEVLTGDDFSVKDVKNVLNVCKISDDKISKFVPWNGDKTLVVGYGYYIHSMVNFIETMYNYMLDPTDTKEEEMLAAAEHLDGEAYDKFVQADENFIENFGLVFDED